jgi:ankyrin repeat protein
MSIEASTREFFEAVRANDLPRVNEILSRDNRLVNARCPGDARLLGVVWNRKNSHDPVAADDPRSSTALHHAAHNRLTDLAEVLLRYGADPNAIGYDNNRGECTPLILASAEGSLETMQRLLEHGADPNLVTRVGITAINTALDEKSPERGKLLVAHGANPGIHAAAKLGMIDRVAALIKTDPSLALNPDRKGESPLHAAVEWGQRDVARLLLQNGAKLTPAAAAGLGMLEDMKAFLSANPHLIQTDLLLTHAAISGQVAVIDFLIGQGADPNEFDRDKAQPLHNVAMSMARPACADSVAPLIHAGADPTRVHRLHTPLARARATNNKAVVKALLESGVIS